MANLKFNSIHKYFPGVKALDNVDITILDGEIHALCGENGAGKSTLMNILAGNLQPDQGSISINDRQQVIHTPQHAFSLGISIVYQHLSLIDSLNVAENIFPNQQPVNSIGIIQFGELYRKTESILKQLQLSDIKPQTRVSNLSPAQKQMIEIAKALAKNPSILILDEPTASLTEKETQVFFQVLQKLKKEGVSIIYISHRLEEIFLLADRISILKDGKYQGTFLKNDLTKDELIKRMVGREIKALKMESHRQDEVLLSVHDLTGKRFQHISFQLHRGEILGIAGLVGAGRTEIARAIFGADAFETGEVLLQKERLRAHHPAETISKGMAYVPEDRKNLGLFPEMSVQDNIIVSKLIAVSHGKLYSSNNAKQFANESKDTLKIATPNVEQKVNNLSGGNQQKVVLAKWLLTNPEILIVDEPTHGIDVGAKFEIYEILKSMAIQGKGVIMISSELQELIGICDRIIVINKGTIAGELLHKEATEEKIMAFAAN